MTATAHKSRGRRKLAWLAAALVVLVLAVAGVVLWQQAAPEQHAAARPSPAVPVTVTAAERRDVPVLLDALGTVQAWNTIAVRSQIDGKLQAVQFVEGQEVHKGDTLALIDPRPFQATL